MPLIIAMFGGLGPPEIVIIFLVLLLFVVIPILLIKHYISKVKKMNQSLDHTERLKELQKMKNEGLITDNEFKIKRQQILDSI